MGVTSCQGRKFQVFDTIAQCQIIQPTTVLCELYNFVINTKNHHNHSSIKLIDMIIDISQRALCLKDEFISDKWNSILLKRLPLSLS